MATESDLQSLFAQFTCVKIGFEQSEAQMLQSGLLLHRYRPGKIGTYSVCLERKITVIAISSAI
jgi:hypothetical protein